MIRKSLMMTILILFSILVSTTSAQGAAAPLIVVPLEGDTNYVYENGQFKPMDFCIPEGTGRPSFFTYSPDGQQFAFLGTPDSDVWVCNLGSRTAQMIADKTQLARSLPVWSPDGSRIAWAES